MRTTDRTGGDGISGPRGGGAAPAPALGRLAAADRRLGTRIRGAAARRPAALRAAGIMAALMSPGFRLAAAGLALHPTTRRAGLRALASAVAAALIARGLRDRIGRSRPGSRTEGGFPSRHAAAATAIVCAVAPRHPRAGTLLAAAAACGAASRVVTGDHEPGDVAAGAALGAGVAAAVTGVAGAVTGAGGLPRRPRHVLRSAP